MDALGYNPNDNSTDTTTPQGVGNVAAQAVLNYRHGDGSNQTRDDNGTPSNPDDDFNTYPDPAYVPVQTSSCYQPTKQWNDADVDPWRWRPAVRAARVARTDRLRRHERSTVQKPLTPQWPKVTTFAASPLQYQVTGPPKKPDGTCCSDADVATAVNDTGNLDDYKKVHGRVLGRRAGVGVPARPHWRCSPRPSSRKKSHTLDTDVKMFFALGNALLDASVGSWTTKYKYDFVRPITAIRYLYAGQTIHSWRGPNQGYGMVQGAELDALPGAQRGDAAVPGVRVRSQHLQRGRRASSCRVHHQRHLRRLRRRSPSGAGRRSSRAPRPRP